jgi:hypothetical protein
MTVLAELNAITLTANAKAVGQSKACNMDSLMVQAKLTAAELQKIVKQVIAHHPVGGGDAANLAALNAVLAQLV